MLKNLSAKYSVCKIVYFPLKSPMTCSTWILTLAISLVFSTYHLLGLAGFSLLACGLRANLSRRLQCLVRCLSDVRPSNSQACKTNDIAPWREGKRASITHNHNQWANVLETVDWETPDLKANSWHDTLSLNFISIPNISWNKARLYVLRLT